MKKHKDSLKRKKQALQKWLTLNPQIQMLTKVLAGLKRQRKKAQAEYDGAWDDIDKEVGPMEGEK